MSLLDELKKISGEIKKQRNLIKKATGSCQHIGRSRCAVADAPSGLVVRSLTALDPAQVVGDGRMPGGRVSGRETVGVRVNNHGQYLGSRARRIVQTHTYESSRANS